VIVATLLLSGRTLASVKKAGDGMLEMAVRMS
jgi:hypothetical protein